MVVVRGGGGWGWGWGWTRWRRRANALLFWVVCVGLVVVSRSPFDNHTYMYMHTPHKEKQRNAPSDHPTRPEGVGRVDLGAMLAL